MRRRSLVVGRHLFFALTALGAASTLVACSAAAPSSGRATDAPSEAEPDPAEPGNTDAPSAPSPSPPKKGVARPKPKPKSEPKPRVDLYDPDIIPSFELTLDDEAMAVLTSTNEADKKTWVHGSFTFGEITFADVGVRRKGSTTFRALPAKASLKVKFNKWVKGQKLYGLEGITLNNMTSDPTFLAERLTYYLYERLGMPAPRANTARLTINGEDYGIYANIETRDENFLERVFGKKGRTLYEMKSAASSWLPGVGGVEIDIAFPGAPQGQAPDLDLLFEAVAAAEEETLLADLEDRLHTQQWLRFAATEAVAGQSDGYAYGIIGYSHNYSLAGDTDGKFSLVPWSADLAFNDRDGVIDASSPPGNTVFARCRKSTSCWAAYRTEMQSVLAVYESLDLVSVAKKYNQQIDALVRSDPKREKTIERYEYETARLYEWIPARPGVIRAQLGL